MLKRLGGTVNPKGAATEHAPGRMGLRCTDLRMLAAGDAGLLAGNISL